MFKSKLRIIHVLRTELFRLITPLIYITWEGEKRVVPKGFITDGHSYPPQLDAILGNPIASETVEAAVYHDWLCKYGIVSRKEADSEYSHAMSDLGWNAKEGGWKRTFRRKRNWLGVRIGAGLKWLCFWKRG